MSRIERLSGRAKVALSTTSQTVGSVVVALGAVVILRIVTHQLGPADYGLFALVITYVTLFSLLADLGIAAMTTREAARAGADRSSVLSIAMSSRVTLSIVAIPIVFFSARLIYPHEAKLFYLSIAVMSLDVLFTTIQVTAATALVVRIRGDIIAVINVINRVIYVGGVISIAIWHGTFFAYICAYVGADMISSIIYVAATRTTIALRWDFGLIKWWRTAKVAFPLGVIQLIGNIYSWIDSILVSILRSNVELGYYNVAFNIINVLGAIPSFLMQSLIPSLVNSDRTEVERLVNRAAYVLFCIGALLASGGVVLRVDIITVLAGAKFLPASTPFAILMVTLPVSFIQTTIGYTSVAIDRYRPLFVVNMVVLVLNVTTNLVLIPAFGPTGAAAALLGSEAVSLVATYLVFHHLSGIRIHWIVLWRPMFAVGAVGCLSVVQGSAWLHRSPALALLIRGTLVAAVYLLSLILVGGVPEEVPGFRRRRFRHRRRRTP